MNQTPTILLIDDEVANLRLLETHLRAIDCSVASFQDPLMALEAAEQSPPDLVLLDLQMPGIDGIQVCRRLKEASSTRLVPVLVVTASDSKKHRMAALDSGADDFLGKPIDRVELLARVRSLLRSKKLMDQLQDANLAKNEFLANMSHEMRQPLSSILGFTEILLSNPDGFADQTRARHYVDNVQTAGRHLLALIADVLDLARIEARRMDLTLIEIDVHKLLMSVQEMMQPIAEANGVTLRLDPSESQFVIADELRLRQIVLNLVSNALKFTPSGGLVKITTASDPQWLEVAVADSGVGIAAEDHGRVFEAFTQLEVPTKREPGAGLGLAMVKQLVELHGGRILLESELGRGTTMRVRLPLGPASRQRSDVNIGAITDDTLTSA